MKNKRILLGITGGIAAYKIASLIRLMIKEGAEVRCIMTPASCDFISPLTIATLSQHPVYIDFWNKQNGQWTNHVHLGAWPDVFLIAPVTANSLAKIANGYCDNLLTATFLSSKSPVFIAPAMDLDMYNHDSTQRNLRSISSFGVYIVPAEDGFLASGLEGMGRMAEPETLMEKLNDFFKKSSRFEGRKVLVTAGPTYEHIDPVRFIGNHSSGKMGYELVNALLYQGAEVVLVSGPTKLSISHPNLTVINVVSALEMFEAVKHYWSQCTDGIFCAAVADYRPVETSISKIKKTDDELTISFVKNPDIVAWAGSTKLPGQLLVGFALETNDAMHYAKRKIECKKLDFIVLNSLGLKGVGFGEDSNQITIIDSDHSEHYFSLKSKIVVADDIIKHLFEFSL